MPVRVRRWSPSADEPGQPGEHRVVELGAQGRERVITAAVGAGALVVVAVTVVVGLGDRGISGRRG